MDKESLRSVLDVMRGAIEYLCILIKKDDAALNLAAEENSRRM